MAQSEQPKAKINGAQVVGSALAAMTSAVLLSTLGVAGTIIGAAAGSLVLTVGGSFYTQHVEASRARVSSAAAAARGMVQQSRVRQADLPPSVVAERAQTEFDEAQAREDGSSWKDAWRRLPWKRLALASVALFTVVMLAISAFELIVDRPVSSFTGGSDTAGRGTSFPFGQGSSTDEGGDEPSSGGADDGVEDQQPDAEQPAPEPTSEPTTPTPTTPAPTAEPTVPAPVE